MTREESKNIPAPYMKPFDLEAGDVIRCRNTEEDTRVSKNQPKYTFWEVESVSKYVFTCKNDLGIRASFRKDDYRLGWITKYDTKPVDS